MDTSMYVYCREERLIETKALFISPFRDMRERERALPQEGLPSISPREKRKISVGTVGGKYFGK